MFEMLSRYNTEILLLSVVLGALNVYFLLSILVKSKKLEAEHKKTAAKIIASFNKEDDLKGPSIFNGKGFIDGGVIIALIGVAFVAIVATKETELKTVSKEAVVNKEEIAIDNSVYQCREIRRKVIKYYDVASNTYKILPIPPQKDCK